MNRRARSLLAASAPAIFLGLLLWLLGVSPPVAALVLVSGVAALMWMATRREGVFRAPSVAVFLFAALTAFFGAVISEAEETYITWSDPQPLGLLIFAGASAVGAAAAAFPGGSIRARLGGAFSLAPATLLMIQSDSTSGDAKWLMVAAAATLVVLGGMCSGGLLEKIVRRTQH
jgi:hypothetical protein